MDSALREQLASRLAEEQTRLQHEIERAAESRIETQRPPGALSHTPTHNADGDVEGMGEQVTVENLLREELRAVDLSLQHMRDGSYGACERCGREISAERLKALPYAQRCIQCEQELEKREP